MNGRPVPSEEHRTLRPATRAALLVVAALALSTFAWWTMVAAYPKTQQGDGPQYHKMLEAAKWTVLRYHEFPAWNPYECGGLPLWDNPQAFIAAPLAWITFFIGTTRTMEVWYIVHSALGFLSMWLLLREDLRLSRLACFIGSAMWAWNGFHQQHYGNGHATFVPFEYFPLALFLWRRAEHDIRYAVGMGLLVAWMMYEGAVYPLPHLVIVLAVESLFRVWPARRGVAMAKAGAVVAAVGFLVAACRFIPVIHQLRIHHRTIRFDTDHLTWNTVRQMFLAHDHDHSKPPGQRWYWHEYGAYIGPFLLGIAVLGVVVEGVEHLWLLGLLVVFFAMMLGEVTRWAPWTLLHGHVFPFKEMRVASRFRAEVLVAFSAFVAIAIDRAPLRLKAFIAWCSARYPRGARWTQWVVPGHVRSALVILALLGIGDVLGVGLTRFPTKFGGVPSRTFVPSPRLYLGGRGLARFIDQPEQNRGRVKCWDEWGFEAGAALWEGDVPQVRASSPEVATLTFTHRTANTFRFVVDAKEPTRMQLNSSYDDGWHASVGTVVRDGHLLAVDVPAGVSLVSVSYWPYGLTAGLWISVASIALVVAFFVWDAKRRAPVAPPPPEPAPLTEERTSPEAEH